MPGDAESRGSARATGTCRRHTMLINCRGLFSLALGVGKPPAGAGDAPSRRGCAVLAREVRGRKLLVPLSLVRKAMRVRCDSGDLMAI